VNARTASVRAVVTKDEGKKFALVKEGVSLPEVVDGLNGLGIGPTRDLIRFACDQGGPRRSRPTLKVM